MTDPAIAALAKREWRTNKDGAGGQTIFVDNLPIGSVEKFSSLTSFPWRGRFMNSNLSWCKTIYEARASVEAALITALQPTEQEVMPSAAGSNANMATGRPTRDTPPQPTGANAPAGATIDNWNGEPIESLSHARLIEALTWSVNRQRELLHERTPALPNGDPNTITNTMVEAAAKVLCCGSICNASGRRGDQCIASNIFAKKARLALTAAKEQADVHKTSS